MKTHSNSRQEKVVIVAEIDEEWVTPLDTRMEMLGGVVDRHARWDVIDAQIGRLSIKLCQRAASF